MLDQIKAFLTDKVALLMAFIGLLFVLFNILLVILQIDTTQTVAVTRYNLIQAPPFTRGNTRSLYTFAIAPALFYLVQLALAARVHKQHRGLALLVLALMFVILLFSIIVSSAIINVNK